MFDQLKQLAQLKSLKEKLEKERAESEKDGVKVVVNGKMEIEEVRLNPNLDLQSQEKAVKDCVNDAIKKVQMSAAQKMFQQ